jgi:predicted dehydrogenase
MEVKRIGIAMSGVTGRMGTNQHLIRSVLAIIKQGGVRVSPDLTLMPAPVLVGRNENKLRALAEAHGPDAIGEPLEFTTDAEGAIASDACDIVFDASTTQHRAGFVELAAKHGKHVYCEKPTATTTAGALALAELVESKGLKNGVVQDKLWLPGIRKLRGLIAQGFFGEILSVRGAFGYWVFTGEYPDQPAQRPSWNYREADGGGIMVDMFCHWRYVLDGLFGEACGGVEKLVAHATTDIETRVDEQGEPYSATADDSAYAIFLLKNGVPCQFNSSWVTRVRRDDLLTIQIDGTLGSAVAGLRGCKVQPLAATPKPVWNPDIAQPIDFYEGWSELPEQTEYDNAFKIQWELFLRHVALAEPFPWTLREGAKGVQLAELGLESWRQQKWVEVGSL